jgi:GNAT superfamily N-acetyltransferase
LIVTTLGFDNLVEVVSVMSDAFRDYPVMRYLVGPDVLGAGAPYNVRLHRLVQLFVSGRAYRNDPMLGIRDGTGVLMGVATMTSPDSPVEPPAFIALRESIWAELGLEARRRYDGYVAMSQFFAGAPRHHHLNMIGVRQSQQRSGLGRVLLGAVHDLAAADATSGGVSLTTERSENVGIYERFGYRVQGHVRVSSTLETWGMFRPRGASSGESLGAR